MSEPVPGACLNDEVVFDFVDGKLPTEAQRAVERHLQACADCSAIVAELTRFHFQQAAAAPPPESSEPSAGDDDGGPDDAPPPQALAAGTTVSRYVVGKVIGLGGGGVVQEAWDPQLRRKVALKLLRPLSHAGVSAAEAQQRLLREAQTMARLSHPNVVYVFDAGVFGDHVFIVMELVDGETLAEWLARSPRRWNEVLEAFLAAGRGLHAAHAAGLVHRDFKPQNVLVAADGRVRVTDFGLARPSHAPVPPTGAGGAPRAQAGGPTLAGGTPAYMAPEQMAGRPTDARSDQFGFCVSLYLALYHCHPFERWPPIGVHDQDGGSVPTVRGRPEATGVPAALHERLLPGLRARPDERYPSMTDLLQALEQTLPPRPARPPRWRTPLRLAAVAALVLVAAAAWPARRWLGLAAVCGDGVVGRGEDCDDGNLRDDDACLSTCRRATCGDGQVRAHVEECDARDPDCSPSCLRCRRGDTSFVWKENGHCYSRHDELVDWATARARCAGHGANLGLAGYSNSPEASASADHARPPEGGHWIGLARQRPSAEVAWIGGEPWPPNLLLEKPKVDGLVCVYEVWSPHSPQPGLQRRTRWRAADCGEHHGYLCEQAPWHILPRDGHAYRVDHRPLNWQAAKQLCADAGGHLATIESEEEHRFVAGLAQTSVWLGGVDLTRQGKFSWLTGEPLTFTAFAPGEPDQKNAACLGLDEDDLWHDRLCWIDSYGAVCEIE